MACKPAELRAGSKRRARFALAASVALLALAPTAARSDLLEALNGARARGCDQRPGAPPLKRDPKLEEAARLLAAGNEPWRALFDAGYRAVKWSALHVADSGAEDEAVAAALARRFCAQLVDPAFSSLGAARVDGQTWLVLAAPFSAPAAENEGEVARRVLELTNQARSVPRRCGSRTLAAARPLAASPALRATARGHARDMAAHSYFAHQGRDGSTVAQRATRGGYRWRAIGENIAAGPSTADAVVQGWLNSPDHCANLMGPHFTETGIAFAVDAGSKHGIYWVQVFGAPR